MPERPSDKYIPYYFVVFFVLLAILLFWFAHLAITTNPGVTTENAYIDGIKYNETIAKAEAQEKLGWKGDIELDGKTLVFTLVDKEGKSIKTASVEAFLADPRKEGNDSKLALKSSGDGVYKAELHNIYGVRDVSILAKYSGNNFQKSKRIVLR